MSKKHWKKEGELRQIVNYYVDTGILMKKKNSCKAFKHVVLGKNCKSLLERELKGQLKVMMKDSWKE